MPVISLLPWFDENPARYWWLVHAVLTAVACASCWPLLRAPSAREEAHGSDWRWGLAILALLAAGRWPCLAVGMELNADETQMLAGAITLQHDPIFWRSVDGNTAGPLNFYILLPAVLLNGPTGYLAARLTTLILLWGALCLLHASFARLTGRTVARIASLPALCFEALTTHPDFLHYSTELLPLGLLAAGLYLGVREHESDKPHLGRRFAFGLLLGAIPMAKLQGIPLGLAVAGLLFLRDTRVHPGSLRPHAAAWTAMILGAMLPTAFFIGMALLSGEWDNALTSYITGNLGYMVDSGFTLKANLAHLADSISHPGDLAPWWFAASLALALGALVLARHTPPEKRQTLSMAGGLIVVGVVTVLAPNRPFAHYLQFMLLPLSALCAASTAVLLHAWRSSAPRPPRWLVASLLLAGALLVPAGRLGRPHPFVGRLQAQHNRPPGAVVALILALSRPEEPIAVWGWMSAYHVESGRPQALRESHSSYQIESWPLQPFYRRRYLEDMDRGRPVLFIDATGPGNFAYRQRERAAHEVFPELATVIKERYRLIADPGNARIYLRHDLLDRVKLP